MAALTTLPELQKMLGWPRVTEHGPETSGYRVFTVWPAEPSLPRIEFVFDPGITLLLQLGFGPWHGHYDESSDERRNLRRAAATARALITGSRCLLVQRSAAGEYLGSGIYRRSQLPQSLSRDFGGLERLVFNAAPAAVDIDLSRFYRGRHSLMEHSVREQLKAIYRGTATESLFD